MQAVLPGQGRDTGVRGVPVGFYHWEQSRVRPGAGHP